MSIYAVAKRAGVSTGTVSRVINNRAFVAEETRQRVEKAMQELRFVVRDRRPGPKPSLHRKTGVKTGQLGLIFVGTTADMLEHPLISQLAAAIGKAVRASGLTLVLEEMANVAELPGAVARQQLDGALVIASVPDPRAVLQTLASHLPIVHLLAAEHGLGNVDHIKMDNDLCGQLALDYFAGQGARGLAFLNLKSDWHGAFLARGRAFVDAARMNGHPAGCFVLDDGTGYAAHYPTPCEARVTPAELVEALTGRLEKPLGLFLPVDEQAQEVYPLLEERGWKPGRDGWVISVGNQDRFLGGLTPRPAAIDLQPDEMARRAVKRLVTRLARPHEPAVTINVMPRLVKPSDQPVKFFGNKRG